MSAIQGVQILAAVPHTAESILSPQALSFVATLHRVYNPIRKQLLIHRILRQEKIENGHLPNFLKETQSIRDDPSWTGPPLAPGLVDRRVEITGPVDRKMVINALNSGANQFMADFEDSTAPTWENIILGQKNLRDAIHRDISFSAPNGKSYSLRNDGQIATLLVRPRGWHMEEKHVLIDGSPCSASIFDFGLYFFHNAKKSIQIGHGPYFYLPKLESHLEARLWNDIFNTAQDMLGLQRGTVRATVLIETILAAFEMEEIIYELRQHSSGLNCGRWDYIFSMIKKFRNNPAFVLPQRSDVTMTSPFMDAYVRLLIKTCHKRGVHAMGGMAAQIPSKDPKVNDVAMTRVRADKFREANAGHDGTWVAHPDLVKIAKDVFDEVMPQPNQLHIRREDVQVTAKDLLNLNVKGKVTEEGIKNNVCVSLAYIEAWLRGSGCVPIHHLMEDAATAEISRSQLWQWVKHDVRTDSGKLVTTSYLDQVIEKELSEMKQKLGEETYRKSKYDKAAYYLRGMVNGRDYAEFLTTLCYDQIVSVQRSRL